MKRFVILSLSLLLLLVLIPGCFTIQTAPPAANPPTGTPSVGTFNSSPSTINSGGTSTLVWNVTGANLVSIDQGIGTVDATGTRTVSPTSSTVYTISATNSSGTVTRTSLTTVNSTPAILLMTNAAAIGLNTGDVQAKGWILDSTMNPFSNDNPTSAYYITFKRGNEIITNSVYTYATPGLAEYRHYNGQLQAGGAAQDTTELGEILAYVVTTQRATPNDDLTFSIHFVKNNVYVEVGSITDYQELLRYAKLMVDRIQK